MEEKEKTTAMAMGISLPISLKQSVEICNFIRGKTSEKAKKILEQVKEKKIAIPYKRYVHGVGHRPGKMASGRYPLNASIHILSILKSAEANAENKGMSSPLQISEATANQASRSWRAGRHRRRRRKSTHIKIVLKEIKTKSKTAEGKKIQKEKPAEKQNKKRAEK
ncbi:50S ribosomal protein L22 [Candidatus Woesearchaeota archaeon]|nr:50S ribosomal protein L22 [Candidatus Woesearchaeota archaeon]